MFFNDTATTKIYTLSLHDALPSFNHVLVDLEEHVLRETDEQHARGPPPVAPHVRPQHAFDDLRGPDDCEQVDDCAQPVAEDRKSTRLNSSHANLSYAVFCLKKKIS